MTKNEVLDEILKAGFVGKRFFKDNDYYELGKLRIFLCDESILMSYGTVKNLKADGQFPLEIVSHFKCMKRIGKPEDYNVSFRIMDKFQILYATC